MKNVLDSIKGLSLAITPWFLVLLQLVLAVYGIYKLWHYDTCSEALLFWFCVFVCLCWLFTIYSFVHDGESIITEKVDDILGWFGVTLAMLYFEIDSFIDKNKKVKKSKKDL